MMPVIIDTRVPRHTGLNRTFYGIETTYRNGRLICSKSLNRTFYGIETNESEGRKLFSADKS